MRLEGSLEAWRNLSSVVWGMRGNEAAKLLRTSTSLIRCFLFFDICYTLACMAMLVVGMTSEFYDRDRMLLLAAIFGSFSALSSVCNWLAGHGLRTWRRGFLVPWLMFYLALLCLLLMVLAHSLYFHILQLHQVFLFFMCVALYSCWRHMHRQFLFMLFPRPEQVVVDVEAVVRDYLSTASGGPTAKDPPPKYEEVADMPPQYDPSTMGAARP